MPKKRRAPRKSVPKKVLDAHRRIWGGMIPAGALAQLKRSYGVRANPSRKPGRKKAVKRLNLAPLAKVLRDSGAKRLQVMRTKSGRATGVKFLK